MDTTARPPLVIYLVARSRYSRRPSPAHLLQLKHAGAAAEASGVDTFEADGFDVRADALKAAADVLRAEREGCGCPSCRGPLCPRCGGPLYQFAADLGALSRADNKTTVCGPCGEDEAILDSSRGGAS